MTESQTTELGLNPEPDASIEDKIFDVLAKFVNQISDDVLRENLEAALERMMPERETEVWCD